MHLLCSGMYGRMHPHDKTVCPDTCSIARKYTHRSRTNVSDEMRLLEVKSSRDQGSPKPVVVTSTIFAWIDE